MVVLDASVVFKWFGADEDYTDKAFSFLSTHQNQKNIILAPDLLLYELTNAWATKTSLPAKSIKIFLKDLQDINLRIETVDFNLLYQAVLVSKKYKISLYDAVYISLAKQKKCQFVTADQKLIAKVKLSFMKLL